MKLSHTFVIIAHIYLAAAFLAEQWYSVLFLILLAGMNMVFWYKQTNTEFEELDNKLKQLLKKIK